MSQRIRVSQLKIDLCHTDKDVVQKACKKIRIKPSDVTEYEIVRKSVDARKKEQLQYIYTIDLILSSGTRVFLKDQSCMTVQKKQYFFPHSGDLELKYRPVITGTGPAGLFCAYMLALGGFRPVVFERGRKVEERKKDVELFWETGRLDTESNVQFGEGGAGTFSDGKLNTAVKDKFSRNRMVLETFVKFGAPDDILYMNKPHIGTDLLFTVIRNMREEIIRLGGDFHFESCVTDFDIKEGRICGVTVNGRKNIPCDILVLACGHSARDTFRKLYEKKIPMEAKAFAVGFRVEHPQGMINESQYGPDADMSHLPVADYKVTYHAQNGRSVYSFCMCPGGHVVNASSEEGYLAVNGMSFRKRDSQNANSAVIVSVTPEDFNGSSPLSGMEFQRGLEKKAFELGDGRIPQQLFTDFENHRASNGYGQFESCHRGMQRFADLNELLPEEIREAFCEGMHAFSDKIKGFDRGDAILSAVESRTSSPVRIIRNENLESDAAGFYPCGEGAGYAGGITSAAMDGIKVAEKIIQKYRPMNK